MVIVISRRDLYNQDFGKAVVTEEKDGKKCSLAGFAEAMYYYYKHDEQFDKERN